MKSIWDRRDFLFQSGGGIAGLALAQLLNQQGLLVFRQAEQVVGGVAFLILGGGGGDGEPLLQGGVDQLAVDGQRVLSTL